MPNREKEKAFLSKFVKILNQELCKKGAEVEELDEESKKEKILINTAVRFSKSAVFKDSITRNEKAHSFSSKITLILDHLGELDFTDEAKFKFCKEIIFAVTEQHIKKNKDSKVSQIFTDKMSFFIQKSLEYVEQKQRQQKKEQLFEEMLKISDDKKDKDFSNSRIIPVIQRLSEESAVLKNILDKRCARGSYEDHMDASLKYYPQGIIYDFAFLPLPEKTEEAKNIPWREKSIEERKKETENFFKNSGNFRRYAASLVNTEYCESILKAIEYCCDMTIYDEKNPLKLDLYKTGVSYVISKITPKSRLLDRGFKALEDKRIAIINHAKEFSKGCEVEERKKFIKDIYKNFIDEVSNGLLPNKDKIFNSLLKSIKGEDREFFDEKAVSELEGYIKEVETNQNNPKNVSQGYKKNNSSRGSNKKFKKNKNPNPKPKKTKISNAEDEDSDFVANVKSNKGKRSNIKRNASSLKQVRKQENEKKTNYGYIHPNTETSVIYYEDKPDNQDFSLEDVTSVIVENLINQTEDYKLSEEFEIPLLEPLSELYFNDTASIKSTENSNEKSEVLSGDNISILSALSDIEDQGKDFHDNSPLYLSDLDLNSDSENERY